ncbi:MAG: hypothetical protein GY926_25785 [bacterium]|nr:hypothetical protein [bacterium]
MIKRLKLYLGLGPDEAYAPLAPWQRITLIVAQVIFVATLIVLDSWALRGLTILGIVALNLFIVVPRWRPISRNSA